MVIKKTLQKGNSRGDRYIVWMRRRMGGSEKRVKKWEEGRVSRQRVKDKRAERPGCRAGRVGEGVDDMESS